MLFQFGNALYSLLPEGKTIQPSPGKKVNPEGVP
jgi:hypothetical protein